MQFILYNGKFAEEKVAVIHASNRSYRYGDGLFETLRVYKGNLPLGNYHFERLTSSMKLLHYSVPETFTFSFFEAEILRLCKKNNCCQNTRVRFSVSGGEGGVNDGRSSTNYLIECSPLDATAGWFHEQGWCLGLYPDARKSRDKFSSLKTASFLPYVQAAQWARENNFQDALVLNTSERVTDSTTANVFWIKKKKIFTPPVSEGCIAGVMRRYLIENQDRLGISIAEHPLSLDELESADEIFLTNALRGIRWVKQLNSKTYSCPITSALASQLQKRIQG